MGSITRGTKVRIKSVQHSQYAGMYGRIMSLASLNQYWVYIDGRGPQVFSPCDFDIVG